MKKILFTTLALTTIVQSCGANRPSTPGTYKDTIVLGKFYDVVSDSTLDLNKLTDLPRKIDLKDKMTSVKNQGSRGTCTFFSTTALLESAIKIDRKVDINLSEEYMNVAAKNFGFFNDNEGSSVEANLIASQKYSVMLERDWGYQPTWFQKGLPCEGYKSSDTKAPKKCFMHNAPSAREQVNKIPFAGIKFSSIQKNTNEIIRFLAKNKRPLTISVSVNFNGWPQNGEVFYNADLRNECLKAPGKCGAHSVVLTGYDLNKKVFFFKNSWGKAWGKEGFGTMTFEMVDRYVTNALYWASANESFAIPVDHADTHFKFDSFDSKLSLDQKSLKAKVTGSVSDLSGQIIYVSSFLVKKNNTLAELPNDNNVTLVQMNQTETSVLGEQNFKAVKYVIPSEENRISWKAEAPLILQFSEMGRNMNTFVNLLQSATESAFLRTTIYVHTDDQGFKVLKRLYQPVK